MPKLSVIITRQFIRLPLWGLGVFFLLFSCTNNAGNTSDNKVDKEGNNHKQLKVATVPTMDCLPFFVALESHLADSLGYTLILQPHNSLNDCDTAYLHGSVCAAPSDFQRVQKLTGNNTVVFDNPNVTLSMFLNKRARLKEAKQLADKMVACDRNGVSALIAQHVLDSVGLKNDKTFLVNFVDLNVRLKMLENNEMDALVLPEPHATAARKAGNPSVYTVSLYSGKHIGCVVARQKTSDAIRQLYNNACDQINRNGLHAYDSIIVKHLNVPQSSLQSLPKHKYSKL